MGEVASVTGLSSDLFKAARVALAGVRGGLAAGGSIGILVPPSIILVIYAAIAEQSVPRLFAACLIPGLLLTAFYMTVAVLFANLRKDYAPMSKGVSLRERISAMKGPWQFLAVFL